MTGRGESNLKPHASRAIMNSAQRALTTLTDGEPEGESESPTPAAVGDDEDRRRVFDKTPATMEADLVPRQPLARARMPRSASHRRRQRTASGAPTKQRLLGQEAETREAGRLIRVHAEAPLAGQKATAERVRGKRGAA